MPTDARSRLAWTAPRIVLGGALLAAALLVAAMLLFPGGDTHAAAADTTGAAPTTAPDGRDNAPTDFGSATPSDRFVQSFQQQVSQQLQSALAQSRQEQESRLQAYATQQRELQDQVLNLQKALDGSALNASGGRSPASEDRLAEPPLVNIRRPLAPDAADPGGAAGPGGLPALLSGLAGPGSAAGLAEQLLGVPETARGATGAAGPSGGRNGDPPARPTRGGEPNIAPHGFIEGRLLNGVVAIVGGPDRESIVALTGTYQSANGYVDNLDGCLALVQGKPEIAAGRIDFKLSRLTCNFADGASRTWDAAGWLVDADGIRGVRATIVENVARKAAVAAAGGALSGIGQRLSQEQYQINSFAGAAGSAALGSTSTFVGSPGRDALGGAASGAAGALGQSIADYYNLYSPSLQVGGGTPVTVVLANDLRLPPSGRDISQTHTANP
jgi:conjugal transfer pilus assembly protein TraB